MRTTSGFLVLVLTAVAIGTAAAQEGTPADTTAAGGTVAGTQATVAGDAAAPAEGDPGYPAMTLAAAAGDPVIFPGDSVHLQIWKEPDLSGSFQVDENGVVTLPLLGPRQVMNSTVDQLRARLIGEYGTQLKNPSIEVTIKRRLTVIGVVQKPGLYNVDPTLQLGDIIALAGGVAQDGDANKIHVERGTEIVYEDLTMSSPVAANLRSGDRVVVGKRPWLARNGKAVFGTTLAVATLLARVTIWGK